MQKIYVFLLVVLIFLVGCAEKESCTAPLVMIGTSCCLDANGNNVCDSDEKPQVTEQAPEAVQEAEVIPEEKPKEPEMNASTKELLTKALTNVKSMSYSYFGPPNPAKGIDITYKAPIMKVKYASTQYDDRKNPFDTVYLNMNAKTGKAYCEKSCSNDAEIQVSYDAHYKITPFEILETISYAVPAGTERIDNMDSIILQFQDKAMKKGKMSVDKYWGLPLKIEYTEPASKIEFRNIAVNAVTDADVTH
jgi:hypothetical protein